MSDTPHPQERALPTANDDTGFDDAVDRVALLQLALDAPIERL